MSGLTERLNRTLADMLSKCVPSDHRDWDLALLYVTLAYDTSCHDIAGHSPFYMLFRREPPLPQDILLPAATAPPSEYAGDANPRADHARKITRTKL